MVSSERGVTEHERSLIKKLDAIGWGLFFIWIGAAFLADVGWGAGLLGVGIITLGGQVTRKYFGLPLEKFWIVVGSLFALLGIWEWANVRVGEIAIPGGLMPIVSIVVGAGLIISALRRKLRD